MRNQRPTGRSSGNREAANAPSARATMQPLPALWQSAVVAAIRITSACMRREFGIDWLGERRLVWDLEKDHRL